MKLDDEREHQWRMVFKENDGGVNYKKALIHAKRGDVYMNQKENLITDGYSVGFFSSNWKKFIWEVVDDHIV